MDFSDFISLHSNELGNETDERRNKRLMNVVDMFKL